MSTHAQPESAAASAPESGGNGSARADRPAVIQSWTINLRFLAWSLVVAAVLAPAAFFWHRAQVHRHAAAVLDYARSLFEKEDWNGASVAFHQYLQLRPRDPGALAFRAQAFDKLPIDIDRQPRAVSLFFEAVEANPERVDLRLRLAERLHAVRRFDEAADHARQVAQSLASQSSPSKDQSADLLKADRLAAASLRDQLGPARRILPADVAAAFGAGLARHPGDVPLATGFADLLRKHPDAESSTDASLAAHRADETIDQMVEKNRDGEAQSLAQALLGRYRYRVAYRIPDLQAEIEIARGKARREQLEQRLDEERRAAASDLDEARQVAPDDSDTLLASALDADDRARSAVPGEARDALRADGLRYARRLLEVSAGQPDQDNRQTALRRAYLTVALIQERAGSRNESLATLGEGLKEVGENDLDLNRALLQLQLAAGNADDASRTLTRIEPVVRRLAPYLAVPVRRRLTEDLEVASSQVELLKGDAAAALPRLKRMAAGVTEGESAAETLAERIRRWRLLAYAYASSGLHDLAGSAYDEMIRLEPASKEYRLLAAAEWRAAGDLDRAIAGYESAALGKPEVPQAFLALAETRLEQQFRKSGVEARDFKGISAPLERARQALGETPAVLMLDATAALVRNDRPAALDRLNRLAADKDLDPALLPRLASLLQSAGAGAAADAALDRYRDAGGDASLLAFARSDILRRRGDVSAAVAVLEQALDSVARAERPAVLRRLISTEIDTGSMLSARERLADLRKAGTRELWVYEAAGDLAMVAHDSADLKACEEELATSGLEGSGGTLWRYFRAVRFLDDSRKDPQEAARAAKPLLDEIEAIRPGWAQMLALRGRVAQLQGHMEEAAENFERALSAGARGLTTYQWLLTSLYNSKNQQEGFRKAAAYIRQIGQIAAFSGDLASQAIPANLQAGDVQNALRVARSAAGLRQNDPLTQVWYGQTLALADRPQEAETVLKKAVQIDPGELRSWSVLIWFYSREKRVDDARQALHDMTTKVKLSPLERKLALARGNDLIGDRRRAEQYFQEALAEKKDVPLLEEIGRFYLRFDHDKALDMYQQALAADSKTPEARRAVALLIGLRGNNADWTRALSLLDQAEQSGDKASVGDDRRLKAALLLIRGGTENARAAVATLTDLLEAKDQSQPTDRLLLARAYDELGQIDDALAQFEALLKQNETPAFLTVCIDFLIRHKRLDDAERMLSRLEEKDPSSARLLEFRVNWLIAAERGDEIESVVDAALAPRLEATKDSGARAAVLRYAADILTRARRYDAAERRLREVASLLPGGYESLALWLAQRERYSEALALCRERADGSDPARDAVSLTRVLTLAAAHSVPPSAEESAAEESLSAALKSLNGRQAPTGDTKAEREKQERERIGVLVETGVLRVMQGRDADAVALYEEALKIDPNSAVVLNNLAVLLADVPGRGDEALPLIDKAIAALPNSLELLDSKALVLTSAGRYAQARDILERICNSSRRNSRYRLHLAYALLHLDESGQAHAEVEQARKDGLDNELLTPAERRQLQDITNAKQPTSLPSPQQQQG